LPTQLTDYAGAIQRNQTFVESQRVEIHQPAADAMPEPAELRRLRHEQIAGIHFLEPAQF
jgi:hypothetical protein